MSDGHFKILGSSYSWNHILTGQQLPRTPPLTESMRHLEQETEARAEHEAEQNATCDTKPVRLSSVLNPHDTESLLAGMKGYQLTSGDLEFLQKMKDEKLIKKLQGDLEEVRRMLKTETMSLELSLASWENMQADLNKFPSCEEVKEWVKVVLRFTSPSTQVSALDAKSLLAMVTKESVDEVMWEKKVEITQMEKAMVDRRKKEADARGQLEKQLASEQLRLQGLMTEFCDLNSERAQQEEAYKALQRQLIYQEVKESEGDSAEELSATNANLKHQEKDSKKTSHTKDDANNETFTKPKTTKSVTAGKALEKLPDVRAVGGRRKTTRSSKYTVPSNQSQVVSKEAQREVAVSRKTRAPAVAADDAGEERNAGLRRSKRIASRRGMC